MRLMKYWLILFSLICWVASADSIPKPTILPNKILSESEQIQVKKYLRRTGRPIVMELTPAKNDYIDHYDRGTVNFNPKKGINILGNEVFEASNYSFHKVIIPDGTVIKEVNFSQKLPHTEAISGKNLTFIDCNLHNVEIDPTWTLVHCLAIHSYTETVIENGKKYEIQMIDKEGQWEENNRYEIFD